MSKQARGRQEYEQLSEPGDFGATLGSLRGHFWGQFGYLWVALRHLMVTLQSLWSHSGYTKVRFQKALINDFIKLLGEV